MKKFSIFAEENQKGMYGDSQKGYLVFVEDIFKSIETDRLDEAIQTMERYIEKHHEVRIHEYASGHTWYFEPKWMTEQRGPEYAPVF